MPDTAEVRLKRDRFSWVLAGAVFISWVVLVLVMMFRMSTDIRELREDNRFLLSKIHQGARYTLGDHLPERDCEDTQSAAIRRIMEDLEMNQPIEDRRVKDPPVGPIQHRPEIFTQIVDCEKWAHDSRRDLQRRLARENGNH